MVTWRIFLGYPHDLGPCAGILGCIGMLRTHIGCFFKVGGSPITGFWYEARRILHDLGYHFRNTDFGDDGRVFERWSTAHRHLGEIDLRVGWISWSAPLGPLNVPTDFNTQQAHVGLGKSFSLAKAVAAIDSEGLEDQLEHSKPRGCCGVKKIH